jgi:hypothetical protein
MRLPVKAVRTIAAAGVAAGCLLPVSARAAPLLRCQIDQGGDTRVLDFAPVADPYTVAPVDINGRFRFKAVVIGDARHVEYIKLYIYATNPRHPMLLHQSTWLAPASSHDAGPSALTGVNHVYSPQLERELVYGCALREQAP